MVLIFLKNLAIDKALCYLICIMIELLIMYVVREREKTLYAIRKEIIEIFGVYTVPSIGTIHPALKRLVSLGALSLKERMSDGGKKSSYYSLTKSGLETFKKIFFSTTRDNPSLFYTNVQSRIGTMSMLNEEEKVKFVKEVLKKIELYSLEIESKLKDEFIELDYYQVQMLKRSLSEFKTLGEFIQNLKVSDVG